MFILKVECPHCGAKRQVPLPAFGSIQIAPCPECGGLVMLMCGCTLALDNQIMFHGTFDEKHDHLMMVIQRGWEPIINDVANQVYSPDTETESGPSVAIPEIAQMFEPPRRDRQHPTNKVKGPITDVQLDRFVKAELPRLDDKAFFKKMFG